jgi:hypothetical protein
LRRRGRHGFRKRNKAKALKPVDEVISVGVPPLIDLITFETVQAHLGSRNPKVTPSDSSARLEARLLGSGRPQMPSR